MSNEEMRIGEFAAAAGVSTRTVRYYIVEGLLPPPEGAGLGAAYGQAHLDRLRLILRLKDAYLPLREIRRQLREIETNAARARSRASPVGPPASAPASAVRFSRRLSTGPESTPGTVPPSAPSGSAASYLSRIPGASPGPPAVPPPVADAVRWSVAEAAPREALDPDAPRPEQPAPDPDRPVYPGYQPARSPLTVGAAVPLAVPPEPPGAMAEPDPGQDLAAEHWVRLRLGDDAELLIRSGAYHRFRDRVDWLVGWARTMFR